MATNFFDLLDRARQQDLESQQANSFPNFTLPTDPATEGFMFTANPFVTPTPDPLENVLPQSDDERIGFLRESRQDQSAGAEDDFDTSTPGDRPGNPDAFGGVFGDVALNVFGNAFGKIASPFSLATTLVEGVFNPQRASLGIAGALGRLGDPFDAPSIGNVGDFNTTDPGLAGALDEGNNDVSLNETNSPGFSDPGANFGAFGNQTPGQEEAPDDQTGGDAGGGSDDRVICTELCRQGLMDRKLLISDLKYSRHHISDTTLLGYHFWAKPYVRLMKRSRLATAIIKPFGELRAQECAWQLCQADSGSIRGKVIRLVGEPLCFCIGLLVKACRLLSSRSQERGQVSQMVVKQH